MPRWHTIIGTDGWARRLPRHRVSTHLPNQHNLSRLHRVHHCFGHHKTKASLHINPLNNTLSLLSLSPASFKKKTSKPSLSHNKTIPCPMATQSSTISRRPNTSSRASFRPTPMAELTELLKWLPLPPDPNHPAWKNRCFDCFQIGHEPGACKGQMVCLRCLNSGHPARDCPRRRRKGPDQLNGNDALRPRGNKNSGSTEIPVNRPETVLAFVHETTNMSHELEQLQQAVVVDALYVTGNSLEAVRHDLTRELKWSNFALTHLRHRKYLLTLPKNLPRDQFLASRHDYLRNLGYVLFPWSPMNTATPTRFYFKAWLEIRGLPPHAWSLDQITHALTTAGLIIHHQHTYDIKSYDSLKLLLATPSLHFIPQTVTLIIKGLKYTLPIEVTSWVSEETNFPCPADTTPDDSVYESMAQTAFANILDRKASSSSESAQSGSSSKDPLTLLPKGSTASLAIDRDLLADLIKDAPECNVKSYLQSLISGSSASSSATASTSSMPPALPKPPSRQISAQMETSSSDTIGQTNVTLEPSHSQVHAQSANCANLDSNSTAKNVPSVPNPTDPAGAPSQFVPSHPNNPPKNSNTSGPFSGRAPATSNKKHPSTGLTQIKAPKPNQNPNPNKPQPNINLGQEQIQPSQPLTTTNLPQAHLAPQQPQPNIPPGPSKNPTPYPAAHTLLPSHLAQPRASNPQLPKTTKTSHPRPVLSPPLPAATKVRASGPPAPPVSRPPAPPRLKQPVTKLSRTLLPYAPASKPPTPKANPSTKGKGLAVPLDSPPLRRSTRPTKKPASFEPYVPTVTSPRTKPSPTIRSLKKELDHSAIIDALNVEQLATKPLTDQEKTTIELACGIQALVAINNEASTLPPPELPSFQPSNELDEYGEDDDLDYGAEEMDDEDLLDAE